MKRQLRSTGELVVRSWTGSGVPTGYIKLKLVSDPKRSPTRIVRHVVMKMEDYQKDRRRIK